ncbi:MAG: 30S ribosomal protein S17 [Puniceicoccaceae bacterium]|nr:MAG: 30S ribosomal protein S17 [Puniceicoccaceae bacterium]
METSSRNQRKTLTGTVTSRMGDKSVKVTVPFKIVHPRYGKVINRKTVLHVHDEKNESKPGDRVQIMETRPISRLKRWRLVTITEVAPVIGLRAEGVDQPLEKDAPADRDS